MRKITAILLAAMLLLTGCAGAQNEPSTPPLSAEITVHNIDELIAAIAPGAEILMEAGEYDLPSAATYGGRSGNPYVKWEDCYDGFQLLIHDLDGLTIRGSGQQDTTFLSRSQNANVLSFEDCTQIRLSGFTAGHRLQAEGCSGGVMRLYRCQDITLEQVGLYGCGAFGIDAGQCEGIRVLDSDIYDCSSSGLNLYDCRDIRVESSRLTRIGKMIGGYSAGYSVITLSECRDALVTGCILEDSSTDYLLIDIQGEALRLADNVIRNNSATSAMLMFFGSDVVMETGNLIENNFFSHWYAEDWDSGRICYARDEHGNDLFTQDPEPLHTVSRPADSVPVITGDQEELQAATVEEFLAAIGPNRRIVLTGEYYDLSQAADYGLGGNEYYTWQECFDGYELVIHDVTNLSIVSADDAAVNHTISAVPRYADVIELRSCTGVELRGFTAGHTVEPGVCAGGVIYMEQSENCLVENCNLYGCGILGVYAIQSKALQVINCRIYECSYGGIQGMLCDGFTVGGCEFWSLDGPTFQFYGCQNVTIDGITLPGDYSGD